MQSDQCFKKILRMDSSALNPTLISVSLRTSVRSTLLVRICAISMVKETTPADVNQDTEETVSTVSLQSRRKLATLQC